jgi:hypothetical protein
MTELEQLRRDVNELKLRDKRREREHKEVLAKYQEVIVERESLRRSAAIDHGLLTQGLDRRLDEFAAREPAAGGPALSPEVARAIAGRVTELLERDAWLQVDAGVVGLLVAALRLTTQLTMALAMPPRERIVTQATPPGEGLAAAN